jgi:hypothetical protein
MNNIEPDNWKNIPLPLVEVIRALLSEVYRLGLKEEDMSVKLNVLDKKVETYHRNLTKDLDKQQFEIRKEMNIN